MKYSSFAAEVYNVSDGSRKYIPLLGAGSTAAQNRTGASPQAPVLLVLQISLYWVKAALDLSICTICLCVCIYTYIYTHTQIDICIVIMAYLTSPLYENGCSTKEINSKRSFKLSHHLFWIKQIAKLYFLPFLHFWDIFFPAYLRRAGTLTVKPTGRDTKGF